MEVARAVSGADIGALEDLLDTTESNRTQIPWPAQPESPEVEIDDAMDAHLSPHSIGPALV